LNADIIKGSPVNEEMVHLHATTNTMPVLLKIASTPSGARVYIDGNFQGTAPLDCHLPKGKYEIKLTLLNYYDWEAQIQLSEEREFPLFVRLLPTEFASARH
jgi:hypothetical protein